MHGRWTRKPAPTPALPQRGREFDHILQPEEIRSALPVNQPRLQRFRTANFLATDKHLRRGSSARDRLQRA